MLKTIIITILCFSLNISLSQQKEGQIMFSVRPDFSGMTGGAFGYKLPTSSDLILYGGIDYLHLGSTVKTSTDYENIPYDPPNGSLREASLSVYNFYIGGKYFATEIDMIKSYFLFEISKPFISGTYEVNGKEDKDVQNALDGLSFFGFKGGYGAEYFFSKNFSLGGEFGLRMFLLNDTYTKENKVYDYVYNPNTGEYEWLHIGTEKNKTEVDLNISLTYALMTLNYYF